MTPMEPLTKLEYARGLNLRFRKLYRLFLHHMDDVTDPASSSIAVCKRVIMENTSSRETR